MRETSLKISSVFCAGFLLAAVSVSLSAQPATAASKHEALIARGTHHPYAAYGWPRAAKPGAVPYRGITQEQRAWNAWVDAHGYRIGDYIPYNSQFHRGGIHCDETGDNILPSCDVPNITIYGGG